MKQSRIDKDEIVRSAIRVADKRGLDNISLKDIAIDLGIKSPSLYNHISGLNEVYDLLAQEGLRTLYTLVIEAAVGLAGRDALISIANAYVSFAKESPNLYIASQNISYATSVASLKYSDDVVNLICKIIQKYEFSKEKQIHVVRTLRSYLHGFVSLEICNSFGLDINTEDSFHFGFESLLNGLNLN